jgi:predicted NACHT family NTPase
VDKLLAFGCAGRGRHSLSILLATMASERGRQTHPDYHDIPATLNLVCALPTRSEEHYYLNRLIEQMETKARLYSPLSGSARTGTRPNLVVNSPWSDDNALELLVRHQSRQHDQPEQVPARDYDDILAAFSDVKRAALLGDPGSGKSTTLRKLAVELARRALVDPQAPIPLFAALGEWLGDEPLTEFLAAQAPEIGWAAEALCKANRLVLLLDGLNEMPVAKRSAKAAELKRVSKKLEKLNRSMPIVGSCRREDYVGDLDLGFDTLTLAPLTPQRIRDALCQWVADLNQPPEMADGIFWRLAGDRRLSEVLQTWLDAGASEEAFWTVSKPIDEKNAFAKTGSEQDALWMRHIPNPRSLLRLASNPFMLTMLFQVWLAEGDLPKNRGDLFGRFVNRLMSRERLLVRDEET